MQTISGRSTKTQPGRRVISLLSPQRLSLAIIGFGILIRVVQYLYNRSLWADEAVLALNIVNRSFLELLQPLDYDQGAPIGFLWVEKLAVQLFGNNEYSFRLFPLMSGILSLLIFYELTKRYLRPQAIPIALALFAILHYLVYYASEVKQYSTDVTIGLTSFLMMLSLTNKTLNIRKTVFFGVVGASAIWFSHPSIFVLAGVGVSSLLMSLIRKEEIKIINLLGIYLIWLVSFAILYFVSLKSLSGSQDLLTSWQGKNAFPSSLLDIIWPLDSLGRFFYEPLGFTKWIDGVAIAAFILGCISFFSRRKETLLILLSPVLTTLFAAYLHKYPFSGRLVLFLTPFFILLIAEGIDCLLIKRRAKFAVVLGTIFIALLIFPPLLGASKLLFKPYIQSEIKPALNYIKVHQKPEDILYVYQRGEYEFKYYAEKYGYKEGDYITGVDDLDKYDGVGVSEVEWKRYKSDLDRLRGRDRVWILFSHAWVKEENERIKSYLDSIGKPIAHFHSQSPGSFVYLYDLN